jgi:hypothetical protein
MKQKDLFLLIILLPGYFTLVVNREITFFPTRKPKKAGYFFSTAKHLTDGAISKPIPLPLHGKPKREH